MSAVRRIARHLDATLSEQAALDAALTDMSLDLDPQTALLVVTQDAGRQTAERFYADALKVGPALASPAAFPWCLANAPCGVLSRRFGLVGTNATWLVEDLDDPLAFDLLADWTSGASVLAAAIRFSSPGRLCLWHASATDLPDAEGFAADWRA